MQIRRDVVYLIHLCTIACGYALVNALQGQGGGVAFAGALAGSLFLLCSAVYLALVLIPLAPVSPTADAAENHKFAIALLLVLGACAVMLAYFLRSGT